MKWKCTCWICVYLLALELVYAQPGSLMKFKTLSTKEGLSSSIAWNIEQDSKGFIWVGTFDGLNMYDGYAFKVYKHDIADSNSLSHNFISSLLYDSQNRLWIGTPLGLDLFEPKSETFIHFKPDLLPGAKSPDIPWIYEDQQKRIWIGTSDGVNFFDENTRRLQSHPMVSDLNIPLPVTAFIQDKTGQYWVGTKEGIYTYHPDQQRHQVFIHDSHDSGSLTRNPITTLFEDSRGNIWIGTQGGGLERFDARHQRFIHHTHNPGDPTSLSYDFVYCLTEDKEGNLWIGTSERGLNKYNYAAQTFTHYKRDSKNTHSLTDNLVRDILIDAKGGIWAGTFRGVSFSDPYQMQFDHLQHDAYDQYSLMDNYIAALLLDKKGTVWVGSRFGISMFDPVHRQFSHFRHNPADPHSISDGAMVSMSEDAHGNIWTVSHMGIVNKFDRRQHTFSRYRHQPDDSSSLGENPISVYCTRDGNTWIGSVRGINLYDEKTDCFIRYTIPGCTGNNNVAAMFEDSRRNFWVITGEIYLFDRNKGTFTKFDALPSTGLPHQVVQVYEDKKQNLWIATAYQGLYRYNVLDHTVQSFTTKDGLPDNYIKGILEDGQGNLWLSTNNGLCRLNPQTRQCRQFDVFDGLQNKEFNARVCIKSADGKMYFGGISGLNVFCPEQILENPNPPGVLITGFQLFNKPVPIGAGSPLQASITETSKIKLSYKQSVMSFDFVALNYSSPEKNQYAYRMEGFDEEWIYSGTRRFATYTNLPPGKTYTFRVKASNNDGVWNEAGAAVQIYIVPPFWATWWFYTALGCGILLAMYGLYRWRTRQLYLQRKKLARMVKERTEEVESQKEALAAQAAHLQAANWEISLKNKKILKQAHKLKEMDRLKSRFFANISHEFRTPLTLIIGPLEEMMADPSANSIARESLSIMHRNARRLLRLINQLLDLSKMENGTMPLELASGNLVSYLHTLTGAFDHLAHMHRINYQVCCVEEELWTCFDADKLEKIVSNLIANAFKFTPDGGSIWVNLTQTELAKSDVQKQNCHWSKYIQLTVSDTGIGIPVEHLPYIFDRFYQADHPAVRRGDGVGIGLALTKELVELHGGKITVQSEPGQGTCFTVWIPLMENKSSEIAASMDASLTQDLLIMPEELLAAPKPITDFVPAENAPLLLIVDDNADLRQLIKRCFMHQFRVEEAADGIEGWEKSVNKLPDLIISDIMMPGQDGLALCSQLKNDPKTSHIPTILLSARMDAEIEGLEIGADDYITKPFNAKALVLKVKNLLDSRQRLREVICREIGLQPVPDSAEPASINPSDKLFLERATDIANTHLTDSNFELETLYRQLGMSRTLVYKKMKALTGLGPNEFIRQIRINHAACLLVEEKLTVTEVMYRVGFSHRSYFIKCFREQFGLLPSEYASGQESVPLDVPTPDKRAS